MFLDKKKTALVLAIFFLFSLLISTAEVSADPLENCYPIGDTSVSYYASSTSGDLDSSVAVELSVYSDTTLMAIYMEVLWDSTVLSFDSVQFSDWPGDTVTTDYTLVNGGDLELEINYINCTSVSPRKVVAKLWLTLECSPYGSQVYFKNACEDNKIVECEGGKLYGAKTYGGTVSRNTITHTLNPVGDSSLINDTTEVPVYFTCKYQSVAFDTWWEYCKDSISIVGVLKGDITYGDDPDWTVDTSSTPAELHIYYTGTIFNPTITPEVLYKIQYRNKMKANKSMTKLKMVSSQLQICDNGIGEDQYSYLNTPDSSYITTYYTATIHLKLATAEISQTNREWPTELKNNFPILMKGSDSDEQTMYKIDSDKWDDDTTEAWLEWDSHYCLNGWIFNERIGEGDIQYYNLGQQSDSNIFASPTSFKTIHKQKVDVGDKAGRVWGHILADTTRFRHLKSDFTLEDSDPELVRDSGLFVITDTSTGGGGCPFLYVWNGSEFEEDNTILAASELYPELPVEDYYLLSRPLVPLNNQYRLQIREFENEVSYLDGFELVVIDHSPQVKVAVTPEGKIFAYDKEFVPVSCVDQYGKDRLSEIESKDGIYFVSEESGYLVVTYRIKPSGPPVLYDSLLGGEGENGLPPPQKKAGVISSLTVEVQDAEGNWHNLGNVPPRFYPDRSLWLLDDEGVVLGDEFKVKLSWDKYYAADELKYFVLSEERPVKVWYQPVSAVNSENGEVLKKIFETDGEYATLMPGQNVELSFSARKAFPDMLRDFVLKTTGYYISLSKPAEIPKTYALLNNYPNPFNANTVILYNLPEDTDVRLEVYNILGQKVKVLVNEHQTAGQRNVVWDGRNDRGETVSSGIYFYRLETKVFSDSKKMLMLK